MEPLVILTGPTAVGKTGLSLKLAKEINAEIISADSMQVYRHMDIGTAKIRPEEMQGIRHHLIDCMDPDEDFNVTVFRSLAETAVSEIRRRGKIPLVAGGTGFYIQALRKAVDFTSEECDNSYRLSLEELARVEGPEILYRMLSEVDPDSLSVIHKNNVKRVIRALEYFHFHNRPISEHNREEAGKKSVYRDAYFVLTSEREALYRRIDERVDRMMEEGLLSEVEELIRLGYGACPVSMQGLGYKQLLAYKKGNTELSEAVSEIKLQTRHFAKRQLTWFRREEDAVFFDRSLKSDREILDEMLGILQEKGII